MSAADVAVGMMDGAYFTSRNELLTFFNTLLNVQLTKIEQTASGAIACQLTEYLFPNSIPMTKVNWAAKSSHEYVGNYKLLQKAFTRNKVQRYVDVDKLIRGKYQDNLEFCQWLKAFFDMQNGGNNAREGYDPVAVRAKGKGGKTVPVMTKAKGAANAGSNGRARASVRPSSSSVSSSSGRSAKNGPVVGKARIGSSASSSSSSSAAAPSRSSPRRMTSSSSSTSTTTSTTTTTAASARSSRPVRERPVPTQKENNSATNLPKTSRKPTTTTSSSSTQSSISTTQVKKQYQSEINKLQHQNTTLQTQLTDLQLLSTEIELNMTTVESERDFYFEKLRGIEVMLQVYKEKEESGELLSPRGSGGGEMKRVIEKIFKVMYAAAEDNVVVDDEGNIVGDVVTMDDSFVQNNNESFGSIRPHAQDELDDDDDELLTSGIVDPVEAPLAGEQVNVAQLTDYDDDDDDDDDELLTSGIISPVNEVVLASSDTVENIGVAAQLKLDNDDDDDDDDDDELLTSGIISPVNEVVLASSDAVENIVVSTQPELDDDDDDDDELLTSGIISPVNEVVLASSNAVENIAVSTQPELDDDDDNDDDDELLTSGIDSGDEAVPEDDATNRSAENARIISQLVGDNDELNDNGSSDEEELLVDDASQDEY